MQAADRRGLARHRRRLGSRGRGRVLEIGAGTGLQFEHYAPGLEVIAIEPDLAMVARAATRRRRAQAAVTLVVADARALPFLDRSFDSVVSALAFCTIPEPQRAVVEMHRVLRPTGEAYLLEHVRASHPLIAGLQRMLTPLWRRAAAGCHLDRPTSQTVCDAGFEVDVDRSEFNGILVELVARPLRGGQGSVHPGERKPGETATCQR